MNYKLQIHFVNDVIMWRAHVPTLINMDIIKSPFLHQCRLHSNGNGFKIVQKDFIKSSSNLQEAYHFRFLSTISHGFDEVKLYLLLFIFFYLPLQIAFICWIPLN